MSVLPSLQFTTPYVREILTHHFLNPTPFPRKTDLYWEYVDRFVEAGLLTKVVGTTVEVAGVPAALSAYMAALDRVPLPVMVWVIPEVTTL